MDKDLSTQAMNFFLKYDGVLSFADSVSLELMQRDKIDTMLHLILILIKLRES